MIREYERAISASDRKILNKELAIAKSHLLRTKKSVIIKVPILGLLLMLIYFYPKLWVIIPISIVAFFMFWYLILEIKDIINIPKFLKSKESAMNSGIVLVREFNIERYIKINSYSDEGDYFIIENEGNLIMIGGQEFDRVRKLKNRIEYIEIMDTDRKSYYHNRVDKFGNSLEPYYVFKGKLSKELTGSDLWDNLTEQHPFPGKLEDLNPYIAGHQKS